MIVIETVAHLRILGFEITLCAVDTETSQNATTYFNVLVNLDLNFKKINAYSSS